MKRITLQCGEFGKLVLEISPTSEITITDRPVCPNSAVVGVVVDPAYAVISLIVDVVRDAVAALYARRIFSSNKAPEVTAALQEALYTALKRLFHSAKA